MTQRIALQPDDAGDRLDRVLGRRLRLSRTEVGRLLERGLVHLNGRPADRAAKGRRLAADDRLEVAPFTPPDQAQAAPNPDLPLNVVAQGAGWLIANKPAGQPVHPLRVEERDTLLNALIARYPQVHGVGEAALRSGVVHRLDVDTSGAVLFALSEPQWQRFREAFRSRGVRKTYLALVHAAMQGSGRAVMDLIVAQHRPARVRVVDASPGSTPPVPQARRCSLGWRTLETFEHAALVEVDLHTGFLHQIRVMLGALGHPIIGDATYAAEREPNPWHATRPMLHAAALALDEVAARCDPPADFQAVLAQLRS